MAKPLTDAITALTTYANTVTGASDTTLSEAVATLANGYGGGGMQIGIQTPIPNILNMFYALENGTAKTGEFTLSQAIPNTETEILNTGLSTVNGLFIADESQATVATGNVPENTLFAIVFEPTSSGTATYAFTRLTMQMFYDQTSNSGGNRGFLNRCSWRVTGGVLYITANFNSNDNYTPFHSGHTYRWVAW